MEMQRTGFGNRALIITVTYLAAVWSVAYGLLVTLGYADAATAAWISD